MEVAEPVEDISPAAPQQVPYQSRISAQSFSRFSVEDICPSAPQQVPYQSRISARRPLSRYHISRGYLPKASADFHSSPQQVPIGRGSLFSLKKTFGCKVISLFQNNFKIFIVKHNGFLTKLRPVLRIHDILVWIRIRGSLPLTSGSGS
jgi:hypothetical protein